MILLVPLAMVIIVLFIYDAIDEDGGLFGRW